MPVPAEQLQVEHVDIQSLTPHTGNPRLGDVDAIVTSMRVNGVYQPIVISSDDVILAGNHRYFAAMELDLATMAVIRMPFPADDPRATRILLADNRTSDQARYDDVALLDLLRTLDDDLLGTGYSGDDFDDLIAKVQEDLAEPLDLSNIKRNNPDLAGKLDRYEAMGRRMIVLDYDQEVYTEVVTLLSATRAAQGVESNSQAVLGMLRQHAPRSLRAVPHDADPG
jgi:ParB family chromosome partitioning protein